MTIKDEINVWIQQLRQELNTLKLLIADEEEEIETDHLIIEDSFEIKGSDAELDLQVTGNVQIDESVSFEEISSSLVDNFSQSLKDDPEFRAQVKGDIGHSGPKGETGDRGARGAKGERGGKGPQGDRGPSGDKGEDRWCAVGPNGAMFSAGGRGFPMSTLPPNCR